MILSIMRLHLLAEMMGDLADRRDAEILHNILIADGWTDTDELDEHEWNDYLERAAYAREVENEYNAHWYR